MERIEHLRQRFSISAQTHRRLAFAALVLLVVIVFTGSAVRLTGSGLGCPTWPKCTETSIHSELDTHGVIEFGNRVLTSLVSAGGHRRRAGQLPAAAAAPAPARPGLDRRCCCRWAS